MPRASRTVVILKGSPADMIKFWNDFVWEVMTHPRIFHDIEFRPDWTDPYFKISYHSTRYLSNSNFLQQHRVADWVIMTNAHNSSDGETELRQQITRISMACYRGRLLFNMAEIQKVDGKPISVVCQQSTNESAILLWHDFRDTLQDQIVANLAQHPDILRSSRRLDIIDWFIDNDIYVVDGITFRVELAKRNMGPGSTTFKKEPGSNTINFTAWVERAEALLAS